MAEENINQSLEPRAEPLRAEIHHGEPEPEPKKASFWTLIIGIFLLIRGVMRYRDADGGEIFGIVMIVIGLISLYMFLKDRV